MICTSLGNLDFQQALEIASKAEMVEIRADLSDFNDEQLVRIVLASRKSIFTFRPGKIDDNERLRLFKLVCENKITYIDGEIENNPAFIRELKNLTKNSGTDLILSYHNFKLTPPVADLKEILGACYRAGANVAKIACLVNRPEDNSALLGLYHEKGRKVILGMGEGGMITRVAAVPMGAEFTFASWEKGKATAPGQLTIEEMESINRILDVREKN